MIYVTGDTHGDLHRFDDPVVKKMKKDDTLIICGDFGFIWEGSEQEQKTLEKLGKKKYQILFVDGAHENYDLLEQYPEEEWNGGRVRHICGNIYQLMRGQVYEIQGKKVFAFGGGESKDREVRMEAGKWWSRQIPSIQEMRTAVDNLNRVNRDIDYIVTHEPPISVRNTLENKANYVSALEAFLEELSKEVKYKKWFFGCMHADRKITGKSFAVFNAVIPTEPTAGRRK